MAQDIRQTIARLQSYIAYKISEEGIRFLNPDYDPDRAQKLIGSSMSRHLSTRNMSSKSMHAFLSNLAHRQTDRLWQTERVRDRQTNRQTDKRARACGRKHIPPPLSKVMTLSDHYNVDLNVTSKNSQMVQHRAILKVPSNRKSYMIYRTAPFSMTLNNS